MRTRTIFAVSALLLVAVACGGGNQQTQTRTQPSTSSPLYAAAYPGRLASTTSRWESGIENTENTISEMPTYPEALADPDWQVIGEVLTQADDDGDDQMLTEKLEESRIISGFVESRGADVARKVGKDVDEAAGAAGQSGFESRNTVHTGLKSASNEVLLEETRAFSQAHARIEERDEELGRKNRKALEKQTDAIIASSFFVKVEGPEMLRELKTIASESKNIRTTIDKELQDHRTRAASPDVSASEKKVIQARVTRLEQAATDIDTVEADANAKLKDADHTLKSLTERYNAAFKALQDDLGKRAKPAAAPQG